MSIIVYNLDTGKVPNNDRFLQNRYNELKQKINSDTLKNNIREKRRKNVENFLKQANFLLDNYSWENIENKIFSKTDEAIGKQLERLSGSSENMLANGNPYIRADFLRGLLILNGMRNQIINQGGKMTLTSRETGKIYTACLQANGSTERDLSEIGNLLGDIGVKGAELKIADTFNDIIQNLSTGTSVKIHDTGSQKKQNYVGKDITVTSDTVMVIQDSLGNIKAKINFSDKFNKYFTNSPSQTSTIKPIKLITRTVGNFISEVQAKSLSDAQEYEQALFNYISYHSTYRGANNHFERYDYTKTNPQGWKLLRQAIGVEMLDTYFNGVNNNYGIHTYGSDEIDIYVYGNKFFYGENIIDSAFYKNNNLKRMAQINLNKRKNWLSSSNIQSKPRNWVLTGKEEAVENSIRTIQIIYSQIVNF